MFGIALYFFEKPAFKNDIFAWEYVPVIQEIYDKYKIYAKNEIILEQRNVKNSIKQYFKEVYLQNN